MQRIDPKDREQWEWQMAAPVPGEETVVSEQQIEGEGQDFMALMSMTAGG